MANYCGLSALDPLYHRSSGPIPINYSVPVSSSSSHHSSLYTRQAAAHSAAPYQPVAGTGAGSWPYDYGVGLQQSAGTLGIGMMSTPGPAPSMRMDEQRRKPHLIRQHRSMDGIGIMDAATEFGYDLPPLSVSTAQHPLDHNPIRHGSSQPNPLSNPITSTQAFWQSQSGLITNDYEQLKADYLMTVDKLNQTMGSIKTFWSPELKRERQMRRDEQARIAQLERIIATGGGGDASAMQLQMELVDREDQIRQLSAMLEQNQNRGITGNFADIKIREQEEMINQLQGIIRTYREYGSGQGDNRALENTMRMVEQKQTRIQELEEELTRLRLTRQTQQPRDFTDKDLSSHEKVTLRMKLERSEMELSERKQALASCQMRMRSIEEEAVDAKAHIQLLKEQLTNREQQSRLMHGDVEALRLKLDSKNQQIEQRDQRAERLERDLGTVRGELAEKIDQTRQNEHRMSQLVGRIDSLESTLREKESQLDKTKVDQLKRDIENLKKELLDRDVLLESQNEKIGDMGRELGAAKERISTSMADKSTGELRKELEDARMEVEKLLRMVRQLEKDNAQLRMQQQTKTEGKVSETSSIPAATGFTPAQTSMKKRIEELEEALRESVSITAEREMHLAQQKHLLQQCSQQLADTRRELGELKQQKELSGGPSSSSGHAEMIRAMETERRQHIEQLMQLKQEALLAAIGEKDAHLALLERAKGPREEIETIRRHKEALMQKLKQENERRAMLASGRPDSAAAVAASLLQGPTIQPGAAIPFLSQQMAAQAASQPRIELTELDETDGIWA
ncbi:hypothetical protein WR25_00250 [Diploscapter pachys]|uniref:ELKS/RAB6-interacting/CAST family member 1 n=1 Tax=Diploscapter pachys TaxID=2018661 RepID=A0A2A2JQU3_9BILA|nr:hypothetical protein WR25_00250 [Diploscapter pachys]